jgi:high-affinity iron transporter
MQATVVPYFLYSAGILFREGLEALLVILALAAGVRSTVASGATRAGEARRTRSIYLGALAALGASIVLALLVYDLIGDNAGDTLEGVFQVFAAATLFYVSSWLTSKSQAEHWQHFINGRVESAENSAMPSVALGLTAFLAVMREGAETIVFFQALMAGATESAEKHAVAIGIAIAAVALAATFLLLRRIAARIPLRMLFTTTSFLLYAMAVVFVGQGVASFQEAGVVSATFVSHVPEIAVLGLKPTVETLVAQSALVLFAAAAILRPRTNLPREAAARTATRTG